MVIDLSSKQKENVLWLIEVTESGIAIEVNLEHQVKAPLPIEETESGIEKDAKLVQAENAKSSI